MSSHDNNFDSRLLQTLMGRLQLQSPYLHTNSYLSQSVEDFLLDTTTIHKDESSHRTPLAQEEAKLEREIIRIILTSNAEETLKPNSGQAVTIGDHHVCVAFHEETDSGYRVWEWHGHVMLFDLERGYSLEYTYGNYFERAPMKPIEDAEKDVDKEEKGGNSGLRELIGGGDSVSGRILHRNMNSGSRK